MLFRSEAKSQQITKEILFRLKFSNAEIANICHLVVNHMFNYTQDWTDAAVRRFLAKIHEENLEDLYDLRLADIYGMNNAPVRGQDSRTIALLNELKDRISKETEKNSVLSLKQLAVNGKDLMKNGISAGKDLGFVLNQLLETVLEDPSQNEKEQLIKIALNIYKKRIEK